MGLGFASFGGISQFKGGYGMFEDSLVESSGRMKTKKGTTVFISAVVHVALIVVFDRIRENLKIRRRDDLASIMNQSINQTLSRTILTSGLTFLTVLSLFIFGGEVLHGFSFALVIGILIGTYSSIAVAAPMLVAYQEWRARRGARPVALPASAPASRKQQNIRGVKARG